MSIYSGLTSGAVSGLSGGGGGGWWDAAVNAGKSAASNTSTWGNIWNGVTSFFGGGDSKQGSSNIYSSMLGGLGGAADALISEKAVREKGEQDRKTTRFEAELLDFYKQKDKVRKRAALDTYGQFSTLNRYAPAYKPAPQVDMPAAPKPQG